MTHNEVFVILYQSYVRETSVFPLARDVTIKKTLPLAARSRRVFAAHLCAHEWNSWIRWRCAVDGAARRVRRPNDLVSSPFDRASRVLCERFGSAARRRSFARSDRESRKFEFASADNYIRDGGAE